MSIKINEYSLPNTPSSVECNALLKGLNPILESRKGYPYRIFFYFILFAASIFLFVITSGEMRVNKNQLMPLLVIPLLSLFSLLIASSYEYKLFAQNHIALLITSLKPLFNDQEKFLTMVVGKTSSFNIPHWLSPEASPYCYLVFTTDRLIITTFNNRISGIDQLNQHLLNGTIESVIDAIYTSPLIGEGRVKIGGLITQPLFHLTHTKIAASPQGESISYTWTMANKHTKNGKLLATILHRLDQEHSKVTYKTYDINQNTIQEKHQNSK